MLMHHQRLNIALNLSAAQVVRFFLELVHMQVLFQALCKERIMMECILENVGQIVNGPL